MLLLMDANGRLRVRVVFGATLVACAAAVLAPTEPDSNTRKWWSHVPVLADDKMRGRDTGSAGYRRAAEYVASQFARARLTPIGEHGYFQAVPLHVLTFLADQSSAAIVDSRGRARSIQWLRQL